MFPLVLAASVVDFNAAVDTQVALRRAPLAPGQPSTTIFAAYVSPQLEVAQRSDRFNGQLSYAPRLLVRFPNELGLNRPLILHQFSGAYIADTSQRTELTLSFDGSVGEADYTTTRNILGPNQAALPGSLVNNLLSLGVTGGLSHQFSQVMSLALGLTALRTQSLDPEAETAFPERTQYLSSAALQFRESRRSTSSFGVRASIDDTTLPRQTMLTIVPGWTQAYRYSETGAVSISVGAAYAKTIKSFGTLPREEGSVAPDLTFTWADRLVRSGRYAIIGDVNLTWQRVFDPLTLRNSPRAGAALNFALQAPGKLSANLNASFFADATSEPQEPINAMLDGALPETVWNVSLPFNYELSRTLRLSFGGSATGIGPHWSLGNFTRETDLAVFVGLQGAWTTGRPSARVSARTVTADDEELDPVGDPPQEALPEGSDAATEAAADTDSQTPTTPSGGRPPVDSILPQDPNLAPRTP